MTNTTTLTKSQISSMQFELFDIDAINAKVEFIRGLKGQKVVIDDLPSLLPKDWYLGRNPHYETVQQQVNEWSARWMTKEEQRKTQKGSYVSLGCRFYPFASLEKLVLVVKFMTWVFVWDDEFDEGSLQEDSKGAAVLREETLSILGALLGKETVTPKIHVNKEIKPLLIALREGMHADVAKRLHGLMVEYVEGVVQAQLDRTGELPTIKEFWANRLLNVGVLPSLTMTDFFADTNLPAFVLQDENIKIMMHLTIEFEILINEMVSFRKELEAGQVDNLVPLMIYERPMSPQAVIDEIYQLIRDAVIKFNVAEAALSSEILSASGAPELIQGCKALTGGGMEWSMEITRYWNPAWTKVDGKKMILTI